MVTVTGKNSTEQTIERPKQKTSYRKKFWKKISIKINQTKEKEKVRIGKLDLEMVKSGLEITKTIRRSQKGKISDCRKWNWGGFYEVMMSYETTYDETLLIDTEL